jgi:hypothetical protein
MEVTSSEASVFGAFDLGSSGGEPCAVRFRDDAEDFTTSSGRGRGNVVVPTAEEAVVDVESCRVSVATAV